MGCLCSLCYYPLGNIVYVVERIASCCAVAAVISCLVATLMIMLGVGVGLGYNYCFVDFKVKEVKTTSTTLPTTSKSKAGPQRFKDDVSEYQEQLTSPDNLKGSKLLSKAINVPLMSTMVVPLKDQEDLMLLISKIKESNKNITLEFIT